jgi:hypothetical protein
MDAAICVLTAAAVLDRTEIFHPAVLATDATRLSHA